MTIEASELQDVAPFIDGNTVPSDSDARFEVHNPATGRPLTEIPAGSAGDVERAVRSARAAFARGSWSQAAPTVRKAVLHRWADLIAAHSSEFDSLDALEMGKPVSVTFANAASAAALLRFNAEAIDKVYGDVFSSDRTSTVIQKRVPRGVVAAVVPWNFPAYNAVLKIAPALAVGNSVILKPSELASQSAMKLARLALEAGLPAGVLNVVPGVGETVGQALGLHMDVDMVTFTGSTAVGKLMLQYAGQSNMKVVSAECGGKSPQIVFDDGVDLDAAAGAIAGFLLVNQGQVCSVGSRLLVQASAEEALVEKVVAHLRQVVVGDPLRSETSYGPLVSAKQLERVVGFIAGGATDRARCVYGGARLLEHTGGHFIEPAVFTNVAAESRLAQEEIFGPVLSVSRFEGVEEAIRLANSTAYGLAAYVWSAQMSTGFQLANGINSGYTLVNAMAPAGEGPGHAFSCEPFGMSGTGFEGGIAGFDSYSRRQTVWFNHG